MKNLKISLIQMLCEAVGANVTVFDNSPDHLAQEWGPCVKQELRQLIAAAKRRIG